MKKDILPSNNFKLTSALGNQKVHQLKVAIVELFPYECEGTGWAEPTRFQGKFVKDYIKQLSLIEVNHLTNQYWYYKNVYVESIVISPNMDAIAGGATLIGHFKIRYIDIWGNENVIHLPASTTDDHTLTFNAFFVKFKIEWTTNVANWRALLHIIKLEKYDLSTGVGLE